MIPIGAEAEPRLIATPAAVAPKLDGRLDDPAWRVALSSDAFTQKFPDEGQPPSERTALRVLYDANALWVGFECDQRKAPLVQRMTRRDRPVEADWVSIVLDTRGEGTGAFEFQVNAAGVLSDSIRFNDTDASADWDENWDARVARTTTGWSVEMRIPLRALRFDPKATRWGLQARRYVSARNETDEWSFIPRSVAGEVSHYGSLVGLNGLRKQSPFELRPFALFRVRRRDSAQGVALASGWDVGGSAGLDFKWHLTHGLTLDATINPDFAQVEADQVVLNLTTYEVFYPEKRPFFLEGMDLFATPGGVVYTRRIGRPPPSPSVREDPPFGEQIYDLSEPSMIYGAAKLTGTVGKRVSLGVLAALTARNTVGVELAGGERVRRIADPMSFYGVFRLKMNVAPNLDVGLIATTVDRFEPVGLYPVVPAGVASSTYALCPDGSQVKVTARCFHDAHLGAVDFRWRSRGGSYTVFGQAAVTAITGGPPRTLLDGTVISSGDVGGGGIITAAKDGGSHWLWTVQYDAASPKLDFNDLGYQRRQNYHHVYANVTYRGLDEWKGTKERYWQLEFGDTLNLAGMDLGRVYLLDSFGKTSSLWTWWFGPHAREPMFDDREVGDGTALERAPLTGFYLQLMSDPRRRVYFEILTKTQIVFPNGSLAYNFTADGKLSLRVYPRLDLDIIPSVNMGWGEPRYATTGAQAGEQLFGTLQAAAVGATLRATWTFTPRLTLQVYAQLFLAQKHYTQLYSFFGPPGARVHLSDLRTTTEVPLTNPDVQEGVVNVNVVLRWEYRLGSTLFLVYTRAQVPNAMLGSGEPATLDLGAIRKGPATDVFLIKATYWWG